MSLFDLKSTADALPQAWQSRILGCVGQANLKVLKMDDRQIIAEVHDYDEGLLVIDGLLTLNVSGEIVNVEAGQLYVAKAGIPHTVLSGSFGTLVIIDLPEAKRV
ncbi:cupin [Serratia sp. Leaf50]|nr:cupin [Serratia sp. Leaf50]